MSATASGHSRIGKPIFMALRKKMRAKDAAMTHFACEPLMAIGACSREDPQPKYCPPTITSPGLTFFAYSGLTSQKTFLASSSGSMVMLYRPGMISSVFMFSPNVQAFDIVFSFQNDEVRVMNAEYSSFFIPHSALDIRVDQ